VWGGGWGGDGDNEQKMCTLFSYATFTEKNITFEKYTASCTHDAQCNIQSPSYKVIIKITQSKLKLHET
jgi:hypothetical protein